ncbi:RNA-binding protein MEX3A-like [Oppia nitens]|uniref:RNA-binding protein MEX3A-like n=1 Tax=Oppia nitens TaxID=1686743 RepID=UPI0023DCD87B|nr:RNA-binding protein MEX3A-like [Oppia nitens]
MTTIVETQNNAFNDKIKHLVTTITSVPTTTKNMDTRQHITQLIAVPTSEHVAQIVGKNGKKIKYLRNSTNTLIKTPLKGDDPVFTVTGLPLNVMEAIKAIQASADHFSKLMESRSNVCAIGEITLLVPIPQQYVGVVVGRNGSVIMKIKEQTNTRINTPKGDSDTPAFEITGRHMNVLAAKEAILDKVRQAYELRTSSRFDPNLNSSKYLDRPLQLMFPSPPSAHSSMNYFYK